MQYFASQLRAEQDTTQSLRASQYKKKRKTGLDDTDDDSSPSPAPQVEAQQPSSGAQSYAAFATPELAQLRVAGLLPDQKDEVPPAPFPHAPARSPQNHYGSAQIQEDMARPPSRLYAVNASSKGELRDGRTDSNALKRNHLNIVSTILHRCLLQGDYERAGRAWGIILRTQVAGGNPVDPRNHGRWGIGAEILLHRKPQHAPIGNSSAESVSKSHRDMFSEKGFELAREYYERMIVQHPNRRTHPHVVDERTFYPAMFSLWIYEVSEKSKRARRQVRLEKQASPSSRSTTADSVHGGDKGTSTAQEDTIQLEELARAMEIAERIDHLVVSPPFDKQSNLLQLRGNVAMWVSDLIIGKTALDEDWDMGTSIDSIDSTSSADQLTRLKNGQSELLRAQTLLQRAEDSGARREYATMSSIDIRLKEVTRRISKLQSTENEHY